MVIHAKCVLDIPSTGENKPVVELYNGEAGAIYQLGSNLFVSLDDIEHGFLRGNRAHPSKGKNEPYFKSDDERGLLAVEHNAFDPRIHFALNCGAKSCPPIRVFTSSNLKNALRIATKSYLSSEVRVDEINKKIFLPRLLLWYGTDFGDNIEGIIQFVAGYVIEQAKISIDEIVNGIKSKKFFAKDNAIVDSEQRLLYNIEYSAYDWASNEIK